MATYALVSGGKVVDLILWDGDRTSYTPPYEAVLLPDDYTTRIGDTYANGVFTPPPEDNAGAGAA